MKKIDTSMLLKGKGIFSTVREMKESMKLDLENLDTSEKQMLAFKRYITVFHPHFIVWVSAMQNACITPAGQYAAADNILLELVENHQQMLWDFMEQMNIRPDMDEYEKLLPAIRKINEVMSVGIERKDGAGPSAVIFILEETSKVFIPWMESIARQHQATDLTYTRKHGEADKEHSELAQKAFFAEHERVSHDIVARDRICSAVEGVNWLLELIFSPN